MTFIAGKSVAVSAGTGGSAQTEQVPTTIDLAFISSKFTPWRYAHVVNSHASQSLTITGTGVGDSIIVLAGKEMVFALKAEGTIILTGSGASTTGVLTYGMIK